MLLFGSMAMVGGAICEIKIPENVGGAYTRRGAYMWDATVLNNRKVARDLWHYNQRYGVVFKRLSNLSDKTELSPTTQLTADLNDGYEFPMHIVPTDLRPDMVCPAEISHACRIDSKLWDQFEAAAERKEEKYKELVTDIRPNSSLWKLAPEEW